MAMTDATATRPGTDPGRASFTTAVQTAISQLAAAPGITPAAPHPGAIGTAVLATPLPARRPRCGARTVKTAASRYPARTSDGPRPALPQIITAIAVTITAPPRPARSRPAGNAARRPPAPPAPASPP